MNFNVAKRRRRPRRKNSEQDDFGRQTKPLVVNERALRQSALLEAQWEADAARIAKQELRKQASDLLQSLTLTVKNLERQLAIEDNRTTQMKPDVTELTPPRHPNKARLKPIRTTINLNDLEALSELAPGTSLAELLIGLKQPESSLIRSASNPNFGSLAQISEEQQRYYDDNNSNHNSNNETMYDDQDEERRTRNDASNHRQRDNGRRRETIRPRKQPKRVRPRSAGPRGRGRKRRGRSRNRRPKSAGRKRRTRMSARLSPPPLRPNFIEPNEKSMKYQLQMNCLKAADIPEEQDNGNDNGNEDQQYADALEYNPEYDDEEQYHALKKCKKRSQRNTRNTRRSKRPQSAPMGGRGKKKRTMSQVEAEVARKEIESLSHAPPTHDEKVKKLHRYNWNQEQTKLDMTTWLPPLNPDGTLGKTRPATASRRDFLAKPRNYRQNSKYQFPLNAPFKTNGGQGLLGKLGYVTGLGNTLLTHDPIQSMAKKNSKGELQFSPNRRFLKLVTRGGDNVAQRLYNYKLEHLPEYSSLKEGETLISINYCSNCHKHQKTTRHVETEFQSCALKIEAALLEDESLNAVVIKKKVGNRLIGALEIVMARRINNQIEKKLLHSRIICGTMPKPEKVVLLARQFVGLNLFLDPNTAAIDTY